MKYIPLVALSAFLFACSQESGLGTEARVNDDSSIGESIAYVGDIQNGTALARKTYNTADFPASKTVTQFPVRMTGSTSISTTYDPENLCYDILGTTTTKVEVYDSQVGGMVPYSNATIESHVYPVNTRNPNKFLDDARHGVNHGNNVATARHHTECSAYLGFIGVHRVIHGKDTVVFTTSKGFSNENVAKTYYDKFIKKLWTK